MAVYANSVKDYLANLIRHNRPVDQPWFEAINRLPPEKLMDPVFLGRTYNLCQSVQHSLRLAALKVPQLTTPARHQKRIILLDSDALNFAGLAMVFSSLGAAGMWPEERFGALPDIKKYTPDALFNALLELTATYPGSPGPWVLGEALLAAWFEAIGAALSRHTETPVTLLARPNTEAVLDLVQEIVSSLPSDGPTLRGMQEAMTHWQAIWTLQHAMIIAEDRR